MTRKLVVLLALGLVFAPAAAAKGPHAILTSGPDAVEPGSPWEATLEFMELDREQTPAVIAARGGRRFTGTVRPAASAQSDVTAYRLTMAFPAAGRWKLTVVAGKRRFRFPAVDVGSGVAPQDYVAFAVGSEAARAGGGGAFITGEQRDTGGGGALPPEVWNPAADDDVEDGGNVAVWLFPLAGVVLAGVGAGAVAVRRRGSR
jgi:hypothetical protein